MSKPNAIELGDVALDELLDAAHSFTKSDRERLYLVDRMVKRVLAREAATTRQLAQVRRELGGEHARDAADALETAAVLSSEVA
ncbi:MAG: hypothetical protein JWM74_899 [Myxococcaceae bacterium]|nr:hypothetical protein [Myxococcaceae bacterium]